MSYTLNNTMITDTVTISDTIPSYAFSAVGGTGTVSNTNTNGLYWGTTGTGSPGQVLTTNGTSTNWITTDPGLKGNSLSVKGNADFDGEVTIKGKSLSDMFEKIEERLAILHPNSELEDKWDELKELGKRYKELEAEIIEKEKVWGILKK